MKFFDWFWTTVAQIFDLMLTVIIVIVTARYMGVDI